jgi:hypothetical protein
VWGPEFNPQYLKKTLLLYFQFIFTILPQSLDWSYFLVLPSVICTIWNTVALLISVTVIKPFPAQEVPTSSWCNVPWVAIKGMKVAPWLHLHPWEHFLIRFHVDWITFAWSMVWKVVLFQELCLWYTVR